ncbi:hypothetical protein BJY01DRAFT_239774 [Aspergillus pseudoustus]|uniref:6-phosphogluconate dehydrogenase NADP-binding domain-containing protein n=1 Tax=Aspergillus pseudoustus TaxID=1810923 RepID=A0ABR4IZF8_9EURO
MGRGMTASLAKRLSGESKIYAYDVIDGLMNDVLSEHPETVRKAKSAREDIIFIMVSEGSHLRDVYISMTDGIYCSTIDIATCSAVRDHIATNFPSTQSYDSPVSGGTIGAANGNLSFLLGAMNMGIRAGLNARVLANVCSAGAAQSTIMDCSNPVPRFKLQLHCKNFGLAIDMAKKFGSRVALGDARLQTFKGASDDPRYKDLDAVEYRYMGGVEDWS